MKKKNKIILTFFIVIALIIFISYITFSSGITNKIKANLYRVLMNNTADYSYGNLPKIEAVINSSGEKLVNTDVALIVRASSYSNIIKLEYSFDLDKWNKVDKDFNSKNIEYKIVFNKTMNNDVYIRVTNEMGYKSYSYKTKVLIDKKKPTISVDLKDATSVIKASDNFSLSAIQFSTDTYTWNEEEISGIKATISKKYYKYRYVRAVDKAGNISEIKSMR